MKFCPECGTPVGVGAFCAGCGSRYPTLPAAAPAMQHAHPGHGQAAAQPQLLQQPAAAPAALPGRQDIKPDLHISDLLRDGAAALMLVWALFLHWSAGDPATDVVYALLAILCSLASLTARFVVPLMTPGAAAPKVSSMAIRATMNTPFLVVLMVAVFRDLADQEGLGAAVFAGAFGAAIAAVPRRSELSASDGWKIAHNWRMVAGLFGGVSVLSMIASTVIAIPPSEWFQSALTFWLLVFPLLLILVLLVSLYALPSLRAARGKVAWQPISFWLIATIMLLILFTVGDETVALESSSSPLYGLWMLIIAGGLCSVPLVQGLDGQITEAAFWRLTVAHAFETIIISSGILLAVEIMVMVYASNVGVEIQGSLIWLVVVTAASGVVSVAASQQLRTNSLHGDRFALIVVAVLVLVQLISVAIDDSESLGDQSFPIGLALQFGLYGLIIYGLMGPKPVREQRRALGGSGALLLSHTSADGPELGTSPLGAVPAVAAHAPYQPGFQASGQRAPEVPGAQHIQPREYHQPPAQNSRGAGPAPASEHENTVLIKNLPAAAPRPVDAQTVHIDKAVVAAAVGPEAAARRAAADPATPLAELMSIAYEQPNLRALVAENPSAYEGLLEWLGALGDPAVNAALDRRRQRP